MVERKIQILSAVTVILLGLAVGLYWSMSLQPSLAAQELNDEHTSTIKTVRTVIEGDKKNMITKTLETLIHTHDDLPVHKHTVTIEVSTSQKTPHVTFHDDFPAAQVTPVAGGADGGGAPVKEDDLAHDIIINGREFNPGVLTVPVGTKVTWINKDGETHTVMADTGVFNGTVNPATSFSFTFDQPGTYNYRCENRDGMGGTVVVK